MTVLWLKSLRYKATHRGTKENDLLMERFVSNHLENLDETQLETFAALIEESDEAIFSWIICEKDVPPMYAWILNVMRKESHGYV